MVNAMYMILLLSAPTDKGIEVVEDICQLNHRGCFNIKQTWSVLFMHAERLQSAGYTNNS